MGRGQSSSSVLVALFYGSLALSVTFLNKTVVSEQGFNFPFLLMACQVGLTVALFAAGWATGLFSLPAEECGWKQGGGGKEKLVQTSNVAIYRYKM